MNAVVRELGRFTSAEDVDCIAGVLQRWLTLLQYDLTQVLGSLLHPSWPGRCARPSRMLPWHWGLWHSAHPISGSEPYSHARAGHPSWALWSRLQQKQRSLSYCSGTGQVPAAVETGRGRATQDRQPLWTALNALLGLMDAPAMAHLLGCFPAFPDIALHLALTGAAVSWPALSILRHIFSTAQSQVRRCWTVPNSSAHLLEMTATAVHSICALHMLEHAVAPSG